MQNSKISPRMRDRASAGQFKSQNLTSNYRKHKNNNPLQKFLLGNFYKDLLSIIREIASSQTPRNDGRGKDQYSIKSILDAGCGEGFTLNKLYQHKIGEELEGIDALEEAIRLGKKMHPRLSLKQGSIYDLPFKDNSFDLVLSTEVLEHLEEPRKALKEIIRVSKKYILLSVPNEPFFMLANFLRGKNIKRWGNDIEHINHWSAKSFQKFIERQNVKIIKVKTPFPWTMALLQKAS